MVIAVVAVLSFIVGAVCGSILVGSALHVERAPHAFVDHDQEAE